MSLKKVSSEKMPKLLLAVSLIICVISMVFSSAIQGDFGKVTVQELKVVDKAGYAVSVLLYRPDSATIENKAPCIITIEGWYNNKEMQDLYSVEYARRGYVVLATDMHGHGDSDNPYFSELFNSAVGLDAAVELAGTLPYVDSTRIALTGHSSGGAASGMAVALDNERATPLISAVLYQASTWVDDTGVDHNGDFGNRNVGILSDLHDEFFYWTTDENGNTVGPGKFLSTDAAKNFVNFNNGPEGISGDVEAGKYYTDGEAIRVIYQGNTTHPQVHFSTKYVGFGIEFFEKVFGAPNPIASSNQVWPIKTFFNALGLAGIFMFLVAFVLVMLKTTYFSILKSDETVQPLEVTSKAGKLWFWIPLVLAALFSGFSYMWIINNVYSISTKFFPQTGPLTIGVWSAMCAAFVILLLLVSYFVYGKKNGFSPANRGLKISLPKLWRTIVLAVLSISLAMVILFFADFFFRTDFRIWVLTLKAFEADKVILALRYLPFFLLYYIVNSVAVNCFNYNNIGGKNGWGNILLLASFNILAPVVFIAIQYGTFFSTGFLAWYASEGQRISGIWLYPVVVYLFIAPILSRIVYKHTKNPYLFAIIFAIIITLIAVANTTTATGFVPAVNY